MAGNRYKKGGKGAGRHVQLHEYLQATEAWASLKPGPKLLYIELKRRFNGSNNGNIILSHREAALALNVHRNTVGPWFDQLRARGFIRMKQAPHLGPSGVGQSALWALEELPTVDSRPATRGFLDWCENPKPRTKNRTTSHNDCDTGGEKDGSNEKPVLKIVTRG